MESPTSNPTLTLLLQIEVDGDRCLGAVNVDGDSVLGNPA